MSRQAHSHRTINILISWAIATASFLAASDFPTVEAFVHSHQRTRNNVHSMAGFLDDVGKFFDGIGNSNNSNIEPSIQQSEVGNDEEIDGVYTGSKRIITIPGNCVM